MFRLSGDQRGEPICGPPKKVNRTGLEPSLLHIQISSLPDRVDTKTILLPPGENWGHLSGTVDEISFTAGPPGAVAFGPAACQMLILVLFCT